MNANMEEYYATNRYFLSQIGSWPYQRKTLKVLLPCLLIAVEFSVFVTEVLLLYDTGDNIDMAIEAIVCMILIIGASTKLINIVMNNSKVQRLLQLMNDHWRLFNSEMELDILRYYADIGRKVTKYYAVYCYIIVTMFMLFPLIPRMLDVMIPLNESRPLRYVYQAEYRVDKEKYYYPILLHTYIGSIVTIVLVLNIDTMYIVCVIHACSLFTAIGCRLENIIAGPDAETKGDEETHIKTHYHLELLEKHSCISGDYRDLITCLRKHQFVLEYVQMLGSTFTHATFVLLILNVMLMSVIGIQLINKLEHSTEVIRYGCIAAGSFTHLMCMCFPGQLLIDRSTEIFDRACSTRWYAFSIKSRKLLRILLYRSFVPCTLTAGKIYVMSMTMCSTVMQSAISYFTAFLSIK